MRRTHLQLFSGTPKIYVILRGGLGNQLHQIAAGVAISESVGGEVRIFSHIVDTANNHTRRGYFRNLKLDEVFTSSRMQEVNYFENLFLRVMNRLDYRYLEKFVINEQSFHNFNHSLNAYLIRGWFQSHEYLPKVFNAGNFLDVRHLNSQTLSIHVRLTDFSSIDSDPLGSSYYKSAILRAESLSDINSFECFSDDIPGALRILGNSYSFFFPEEEAELRPDELLLRMAQNQFIICSRSSLSWWAAQIVSANQGTVFSPWNGNVNNSSWISVFH